MSSELLDLGSKSRNCLNLKGNPFNCGSEYFSQFLFQDKKIKILEDKLRIMQTAKGRWTGIRIGMVGEEYHETGFTK